MPAPHGQKWPHCSPQIKHFIDSIAEDIHAQLGDNLISILLHGSLAMGCFYPPKSDIDLLVICRTPLADSTKRALHRGLLKWHDTRPIVGSIEMSVILEDAAKHPIHPMPYELHFSESHAQAIRNGTYQQESLTDPDLSAHCMVARHRGITLWGDNVLGEVTIAAYKAAILDDLEWIVDGDNILTTPFYGILNSCRAVQALSHNELIISSKEEGAFWALEHFPEEYHSIIHKALEAYQSATAIEPQERRTAGLAWDKAALRDFRDYVHTQLPKA